MGSPSVSPTSSMVDWSDGHYQYVKQRVLAINPDRVFSGIVQARSWPIEQATPESFYLLLGNNAPLKGDNPWSAKAYSEKVQWAWQILGTDIASNAIQRNRGDRYRTNFTMCQELLQGMFPGYCEKLQYSLEEVNGSPVLVGTSYVPKEMLWFRPPVYTDRFERSSGILFGYAASEITGFGPTMPNP
jgi:hypothetical protein